MSVSLPAPPADTLSRLSQESPPGSPAGASRTLAWYQLFRRPQLVQSLEAVQDLIAVSLCLFLATAALLMVVRVWLPPTFAGVDPEAQVSARMRPPLNGQTETGSDWSV